MHEQYIEYHQIIDSFVSENSEQVGVSGRKPPRSSETRRSHKGSPESESSGAAPDREERIRQAFIRVLNEEIRDLLGKP